MMSAVVSRTLRLGVAIVFALVVIRQCRKPMWWIGRLLARLMNSTHRALTTWGLGYIAIADNSTILDVGCGGGRTIQDLAHLAPRGKAYGIDYSAASVAVARQTNAASIELGRVDIRQGSVSKLPFAAESFDVVIAVETHYYWPNLEADLREVHRVLKPQGRVAVIAESYRGKRFGAADVAVMRLLGSKLLSVDDHRDALAAAGFSDVEAFENRRKGWLCVVGTHRIAPDVVENTNAADAKM